MQSMALQLNPGEAMCLLVTCANRKVVCGEGAGNGELNWVVFYDFFDAVPGPLGCAPWQALELPRDLPSTDIVVSWECSLPVAIVAQLR